MLRRASTLNRGAITAQYLPCPAWYRVNAAHGEISFANLTLIMRRYRLIDRPLSTNYELPIPRSIARTKIAMGFRIRNEDVWNEIN